MTYVYKVKDVNGFVGRQFGFYLLLSCVWCWGCVGVLGCGCLWFLKKAYGKSYLVTSLFFYAIGKEAPKSQGCCQFGQTAQSSPSLTLKKKIFIIFQPFR